MQAPDSLVYAVESESGSKCHKPDLVAGNTLALALKTLPLCSNFPSRVPSAQELTTVDISSPASLSVRRWVDSGMIQERHEFAGENGGTALSIVVYEIDRSLH